MKKLTLESGKVIEISDESYKALSDGIREKRWVPTTEATYWYVCDNGNLSNCWFENDAEDKFRLNTGNCFKTNKEAQAHADKLKAIAKVTEYIYSNSLESADQECKDYTQSKFVFFYDSEYYKLIINGNLTVRIYSPIPYIKDGESAKQVLENCKEELLKIYK
jgi:hypothetical protein